MELALGRVKTSRKNTTEMCPGCTEKERVNDKGECARQKRRKALHWDIL